MARNPFRYIDPNLWWAALVLAIGAALFGLYGCGLVSAHEEAADEFTLFVKAAKEVIEETRHVVFDHLPIFLAGYFIGRPMEAVAKVVNKKLKPVKRVKGWWDGRKTKKKSSGRD